jgi:hypothetical protein
VIHDLEVKEVVTTYERHFQTLLVGLTLVVLTWVGVTITNNSETLARMDERVKSMEEVITDMKKEASIERKNTYTWHDAKQTERNWDLQILGIEARLEKLENKK